MMLGIKISLTLMVLGLLVLGAGIITDRDKIVDAGGYLFFPGAAATAIQILAAAWSL